MILDLYSRLNDDQASMMLKQHARQRPEDCPRARKTWLNTALTAKNIEPGARRERCPPHRNFR